MEHLVVGAGGTGGAIAAVLGRAGIDVTLMARGGHLAAMQRDGLRLRHKIGDAETVSYIKAIRCVSAEEYLASGAVPDVIWLCTKSYSVADVAPFLNRAAGDDTVIIPILNGILMSRFVGRYVTRGRLIDGSIFVAAQKDGTGGVFINSDAFRIVFGDASGTLEPATAVAIAADLRHAGIDTTISDDIVRDTVRKLSFTAPTAGAGLYYECNIGGLQVPGPARDLAVAMCREVQSLGEAMGAVYDGDLAEALLANTDRMPPEANASLQRDVIAGRENEAETLIFEPIRIGREYGLDMPSFRSVAAKVFGIEI